VPSDDEKDDDASREAQPESQHCRKQGHLPPKAKTDQRRSVPSDDEKDDDLVAR
jgi:hypothetical protein